MREATRFRLVTPPPGSAAGGRAGAIAMIALHGPPGPALRALGIERVPPVGSIRLVDLGGIDQGVLARFGEADAAIFPHAGPEVVRSVVERLSAGGCVPLEGLPGEERALYPEAESELEARALHALARAASPLAIDLLAAQPARWRRDGPPPSEPETRDLRLRRLLEPPRVCVTGPANAGKSTLLNALAGREVAIAHAQPGTTRDAVSARIDLAGLVVDWFDTPGVRAEMDAVERAAARLAERALAHADLVVELSAPGLGWHALPAAPGAERIRVLNQCDRADACLSAESGDAALRISALRGDGIERLVSAVRDALVPPTDLASPRPWRFA